MRRLAIVCLAAACASYCSYGHVGTKTTGQDVTQMQGSQLQGTSLLGIGSAHMTMYGFQFGSATLNGAPLDNLQIEKGGLIAEQNQVALSGSDLLDAHLTAQWHDNSVNPPATVSVEYRIAGIEAESASYDPTNTGNTFLYTLEQNVDNTGSWQTACPADSDGKNVAIPMEAIWDDYGNRVESPTLFTFGCTKGVVAKCYRWGYRPWLTGYGDMVSAHWTCTRVARADYCGNGRSYTYDGTEINVWDNLPSPGPIQAHGTTPTGMVFEAGWDTGGAVCFSHARWNLKGTLVALHCPGRLIAPIPPLIPGTLCDTVSQVLGQSADAMMFDEADVNLNLDLFDN